MSELKLKECNDIICHHNILAVVSAVAETSGVSRSVNVEMIFKIEACIRVSVKGLYVLSLRVKSSCNVTGLH